MPVETLGELWRNGWAVSASCRYTRKHGMKSGHGCTWKADLDVNTLLVTRGAPFPVARLPEMMICPRCRRREVILTFKAPGQAVFRIAG